MILAWAILASPFVGIFPAILRKFKLVPLFPCLSFILILVNLQTSGVIAIQWFHYASFGLWLNKISIFLAAVISFVTTVVLCYSLAYMRKGLRRFYTLMLLFSGCMLGVVLSPNLLELFIFWEGISISSYFLIQHKWKEEKARRAAILAYLTTKIGDLCLLVAIIVFWTQLGTFCIPSILQSTPQNLSLLVVLLGVAAFTKCAQFPFHYWLPRAMEAPAPVSALLHSATLVQAGVYLLARFFPLIQQVYIGNFIAYLAAGSALLTGIFALGATDLKKILAYSTSSQIGYMLVGAVTSIAGVFASLFLLAAHAIFKPLLFLCAGNILRKINAKNIMELGRLWKRMPLTFFFFFIGTLSLAAIPPLNGFWGKEFITSAIADPNLKLMLHFGFIITLAYSFRMLAPTIWRKATLIHKEASLKFLLPIVTFFVAIFATVFLIPSYSSWTKVSFSVEISPIFISIPIAFGLLFGWGKISPGLKSVFIQANDLLTREFRKKESYCEATYRYLLDLSIEYIAKFKKRKKFLLSVAQLNPTKSNKAITLTVGGIIAILIIVLI